MTSAPVAEKAPERPKGGTDGDQLDAQTFPPLQWAVRGIIPEGTSFLVGPPKAGKSFAALDVLLATACGGHAFGKIRVDGPRRVLYLALEDSHRRMQERCRSLLKGAPIPKLFTYMIEIEPGTLIDTLESWLAWDPGISLIVIDTLGKVMPPTAPGESSYGRDYRVIGRIKKISDSRPGLSIVILHHDRKAASDDFVDSVSGTNGLTGAADTTIVLARKRNSPEGVLKVVGRDVGDGEFALTFADDGTGWLLAGADLEASAAIAASREDDSALSTDMRAILDFVDQHPEGITAKTVADKFGGKSYQYLRRLLDSGRIENPSYGNYCPAPAPAPRLAA